MKKLMFLRIIFIALVVASGASLLYFFFGDGPYRGESFIAAIALDVVGSVVGFLVKRSPGSTETDAIGPNV